MQYVVCGYGDPSRTGSPADGSVTGQGVERGDSPGQPGSQGQEQEREGEERKGKAVLVVVGGGGKAWGLGRSGGLQLGGRI